MESILLFEQVKTRAENITINRSFLYNSNIGNPMKGG